MGSLVLTVRVVELALRETGDGRDEAGENIVNVACLWPRPGKAAVMGSSGLVRLRDRPAQDRPAVLPALLEAPLLKEKVAGDVALLVHVLDRDRQGAFRRFLRTVAAAALEGTGDLVLGAVPELIRHAFSEAAERGAVLVRGDAKSDERIEAVAVSRRPVVLSGAALRRLRDAGTPRRVRVVLDTPAELARPREKGRLRPGRRNGHAVLELTVDEA